MKTQVTVFWFRRDLRLEDNAGLFYALQSSFPVLPIFIFDENIIENLPNDDARIGFIYDSLEKINHQLQQMGSSLLIKKGTPQDVWQDLVNEFDIKEVFYNKDYEPQAIKRDQQIGHLLNTK